MRRAGMCCLQSLENLWCCITTAQIQTTSPGPVPMEKFGTSKSHRSLSELQNCCCADNLARVDYVLEILQEMTSPAWVKNMDSFLAELTELELVLQDVVIWFESSYKWLWTGTMLGKKTII